MADSILDRKRAALTALQREQIVEGFVLACTEKGYAAATINDIVRAAHVSKTTFYEHFTDKEAVYLHLHARVAEATMTALRDAIDRSAGANAWRDRVRAAVTAYLECVAGDPAFLTQMRIEASVATPGAREARRRAGAAYVELNLSFAEQLASDFPELSPAAPALVRAAISGMAALVADTAESGPDAVRALADDLTEFWARLSRAAPG